MKYIFVLLFIFFLNTCESVPTESEMDLIWNSSVNNTSWTNNAGGRIVFDTTGKNATFPDEFTYFFVKTESASKAIYHADYAIQPPKIYLVRLIESLRTRELKTYGPFLTESEVTQDDALSISYIEE